MSYYDQVLDPKRDQTNARKALQAYLTLLQRYPDSRYAAEAQNRARILRDLLAASEMTVGRYYLRHNNYLAAINRFRVVVTDYQTTRADRRGLESPDGGLYGVRASSTRRKRRPPSLATTFRTASGTITLSRS